MRAGGAATRRKAVGWREHGAGVRDHLGAGGAGPGAQRHVGARGTRVLGRQSPAGDSRRCGQGRGDV